MHMKKSAFCFLIKSVLLRRDTSVSKQIEIPSLLTVFLTILLNVLHFMPAFAIMTIDRQRVAHCIPAAFFRPRSQPPKRLFFRQS